MRIALLTVLTVCAGAQLPAQIPDGATVVASFANTFNSNGGLFVVDCTGAPSQITGLPPALQKANFVLRDPTSGHLISGPITTGPGTIEVFELAVGSGPAATVVGTHLLGTAGASGGGINQAAWLPNGRVLLATHNIVSGPAASQDLWILDLRTGVLTPPRLGSLTPLWFNAVAVTPSGSHAYVTPYATTGSIYEIPLTGAGSPRLIARLPVAPNGNRWFPTGLLWDCNGDLVATATHGPLGSSGAVFRLRPSPGTWPFTFVSYPQMSILQGGALDPVTCDLVLVTGLWSSPPVNGQGALFRLSPAGTVTPVSSGPTGGWGSPSGVDLDPNPELYGAGTPSPTGLRLAWQYGPFPGGPPRLGTPGFGFAFVSSGGAPAVSTVFLSFGAQSPPIVAHGVNVLINLASATSLGLAFTPTPNFPLPIPASPVFLGMVLYAQGVGVDPAGGCASTAGLVFTVGC